MPWARAKRPSRSTAPMPCRRCRPRRSPNLSAWPPWWRWMNRILPSSRPSPALVNLCGTPCQDRSPPAPSRGVGPKANTYRTKGQWYPAGYSDRLVSYNGVWVTPHGKEYLMSQTQPVVAIVDDDVSIQRALARLLYAAGWHAVTFS